MRGCRTGTLLAVLATVALVACHENPIGERTVPAKRQASAPALPTVTCPAGWSAPRTGLPATPGVVVCTRQAPSTRRTEYLQLISLARGARLLNLTEGLSASATNPSPQLRKHDVDTWWKYNDVLARRACIVNGEFFTNKSPVPRQANRYVYAVTDYAFLSFPVKDLDRVVSAGSETGKVSPRYAFLWDDRRGTIRPYNGAMNDYSSAMANLPYRFAVVGYAAGFNPNASEARTYIGLQGAGRDGTSGTIAVYVTLGATWAQAQNALNSANVLDAVQLDGGGSAQLRCGDLRVQSGGRAVPHVMFTQAAPK